MWTVVNFDQRLDYKPNHFCLLVHPRIVRDTNVDADVTVVRGCAITRVHEVPKDATVVYISADSEPADQSTTEMIDDGCLNDTDLSVTSESAEADTENETG